MRLSWDEADPPETEAETTAFDAACEDFSYRRADIELVVSQACLKPDFGEAPLDDDVARLAMDLGMSPDAIARWRDLPDPPQAALDTEAEDIDWRSSA